MLHAEDYKRTARYALRGKWPLAIGTGLIAGLLGSGSRGGSSNGGGNGSHFDISNEVTRFLFLFILGIITVVLIWSLITFFFGGAVELGYCRFNKNLIHGTNPQFKDLFSRFNIFWKALGLRIVILIFIAFWSILLIIPGIIAAFNYSMAFYIMEEDPSMGIMDAIRESKEMMRGNRFHLFCLYFSFIGWFFLCAFTLGIGYLWLGPYISASHAAFFLDISGKLDISKFEIVEG